jgi:predicted MFS family arabinose efflux permease
MTPRGPLGMYNFTGDVGKATIPALTSVLLTLLSWRLTLLVIALIGVATAIVIASIMPPIGQPRAEMVGLDRKPGGGRGGFPLLLAIGVMDSAVRMGLLVFLPFLLTEKGAALPTVGLALSLVFIGGAIGKLACGWLGARFGMLPIVLLTESGTAACIFAVLALPLGPCLLLLPLLGMMLNGTSSVLYGTVPEVAPPHRAERAFALFYTGTIGSGAVSPVLYGFLGDAVGVHWATVATAATALAIFPLALALAPRLASSRQSDGTVSY